MSRSTTLTWTAPRRFQVSHIPREFGPEENAAGDRARWMLALGVASLFFGPLGVVAWMAGNSCLKAITDGRMDPTCESNAKAGRLLGIVALGMFAVKLVAFTTFLTVFYWIDFSGWMLALFC